MLKKPAFSVLVLVIALTLSVAPVMFAQTGGSDRSRPAFLDNLRLKSPIETDGAMPRLDNRLAGVQGPRQVIVRLSTMSVGELVASPDPTLDKTSRGQRNQLKSVKDQQDRMIRVAASLDRNAKVLGAIQRVRNLLLLEIEGAKLAELAANPEQEHAELTAIYVKRGLDESLASQVSTQLMQHDALAAHGRDELGISDTLAAKPVQAALASAGTFAVGAALPLLMVLVLPASALMWGLAGSSLLFLALLGLVAARAGGAPVIASVMRVAFWGALAMALTAAVGALFGVAA